MKICKLKLILMSVVILSLFMIGCASGKKISKVKRVLPEWVKNPPKSDNNNYYGIGKAEIPDDFSASLNAADLDAMAAIAKTLQGEIDVWELGRGKLYDDYRELFSRANLTGATIIKREVGEDGTCYSLCEYSVDKSKTLFQNTLNNILKQQENQYSKKEIENIRKRIDERFNK